LEGVRPEAPLFTPFQGGMPRSTPFGETRPPHWGNTPPASPRISPKGGRGETFPQGAPHPKGAWETWGARTPPWGTVTSPRGTLIVS
jgi:hypothetical protein